MGSHPRRGIRLKMEEETHSIAQTYVGIHTNFPWTTNDDRVISEEEYAASAAVYEDVVNNETKTTAPSPASVSPPPPPSPAPAFWPRVGLYALAAVIGIWMLSALFSEDDAPVKQAKPAATTYTAPVSTQPPAGAYIPPVRATVPATHAPVQNGYTAAPSPYPTQPAIVYPQPFQDNRSSNKPDPYSNPQFYPNFPQNGSVRRKGQWP